MHIATLRSHPVAGMPTHMIINCAIDCNPSKPELEYNQLQHELPLTEKMIAAQRSLRRGGVGQRTAFLQSCSST
jgi:hypothetical protein